MALSQLYSAIAGDTITAARWNNEFGNIYSNGTDVAFPLTKAVSLAGYTLTCDVAGVSTITSPASSGFLFTVGSKSGTPGPNGSLATITASTFTDTNTSAAGTAALWTGVSIRIPTLAASAAGVITTAAATVYIEGPPAAGSNQTLTSPYALFVDAGVSRFDGAVEAKSTLRCDGTLLGVAIPILNEFRLTLTSGLPVTTADVTGAGTLYLTPYKGKHISLYDGSLWNTYISAEMSLALTLTSGKPYDIFCYANAGVPTLEVLVWTNDTTRATALAYQDGVLVKSGTTTRRYMGTLYASGANTTEDSLAKRFLWNYEHRVVRPMLIKEATDSYNYTAAAYRQVHNDTANQLDFVIGVSEDAVTALAQHTAMSDTVTVQVITAIGLDSATTPATSCIRTHQEIARINQTVSITATVNELVTAGRHYLAWLEWSTAAGTTTWYGDNGGTIRQSGIQGMVRG